MNHAGISPESSFSRWILEFNRDTETWTEIGSIESRSTHDVSVVSYDDYAKWCL